MPTFSLIVPIYKVEEYLPKCIDSVLAQTCQDYELLLVDDGSPDNSGKICDEYAAKYPDRIRAIHQPNGGAGAARNHGISVSTGEYILFLDGDDYLSENLLSDLKNAMEKTAADLYVFGAIVEKDGKEVGQLHELIPCDQLCSAKEHPELFFGVMAPWNRAYKRSLFTDYQIEFASKVWYEDIRVVTKIHSVAASALRLPGAYYHYLQREGSAMNNKNVARNVEIIYAFDDLRHWFESHDFCTDYKNELEFLAIQHLLIAASVRVAQIDRKHQLLSDFQTYTQQHFPDFRDNPYLPTLDSNKRLIYRLLLKKRYRTVCLIFRIKSLLGK